MRDALGGGTPDWEYYEYYEYKEGAWLRESHGLWKFRGIWLSNQRH